MNSPDVTKSTSFYTPEKPNGSRDKSLSRSNIFGTRNTSEMNSPDLGRTTAKSFYNAAANTN